MTRNSESKSSADGQDGRFDQFKVIAIVYSITLLFFLAGIFLLWIGLSERMRSRSDTWKSTVADVVEAEIVEIWNPRFKEGDVPLVVRTAMVIDAGVADKIKKLLDGLDIPRDRRPANGTFEYLKYDGEEWFWPNR